MVRSQMNLGSAGEQDRDAHCPLCSLLWNLAKLGAEGRLDPGDTMGPRLVGVDLSLRGRYFTPPYRPRSIGSEDSRNPKNLWFLLGVHINWHKTVAFPITDWQLSDGWIYP